MPEVEYCRCGAVLQVEQVNVSHALAEPDLIRGRVTCPVCDARWPVDESGF